MRRIAAKHLSLTLPPLNGPTQTLPVYSSSSEEPEDVRVFLAAYSGTIGGVTLQLLVDGVPVGVPQPVPGDGVYMTLLPVAVTVPVNPGEHLQVQVQGGTAGDLVSIQAHLADLR